jgi:ubiquinone/menaquinone biosynthesis C-methylase UbiE
MARFAEIMRPNLETRILDVGGHPTTWQIGSKIEAKIAILNIEPRSEAEMRKYGCRYDFVTADGTSLPYADKAFDIVFSNSVIEHVGDCAKQKLFASEILRTGKNVWVQTPARSFFVEPHLIAPFIHWLPSQWTRRLTRYFSVWGLATKPSKTQISTFLDGIRLVNYREMQQFFPGCEIIVERFIGMPKSYIAVRKQTA